MNVPLKKWWDWKTILSLLKYDNMDIFWYLCMLDFWVVCVSKRWRSVFGPKNGHWVEGGLLQLHLKNIDSSKNGSPSSPNFGLIIRNV